MLLPNVDGTTLDSMHSLSDKYPEHCLPMIGLHPTSVDEAFQEDIRQIRQQMLVRGNTGESEKQGLTFTGTTHMQQQQEEAFREHIKLAMEFKLPLIIHARNSFKELFRIMDQENDEALKGIFHAFTGNLEQARQIWIMDSKLGIGGILTFKNSNLDTLVREIDLQHIVLETDAPYFGTRSEKRKKE